MSVVVRRNNIWLDAYDCGNIVLASGPSGLLLYRHLLAPIDKHDEFFIYSYY
jgi:hypothetical protein